MSEEFPLTVEMLLNVLEVIAPFKHFAKLREFVQMKLPSGFPVKIDIPILPTVSAKITFQEFAFKDDIPDSYFEVPATYKEDPNRFPELWRYEDLSLVSVSSAQEQQQQPPNWSYGKLESSGIPPFSGSSHLLTLLPCTSPQPPPLLKPSQCARHLSSPTTLQGLEEERKVGGGLSSEPSFYSVSSVISGSSHVKSEAAEIPHNTCWSLEKSNKHMCKQTCDGVIQQSYNVVTAAPWKNSTIKLDKDNQYNVDNTEIHPRMFRSDDMNSSYLGDVSESMDTMEDMSFSHKGLSMPRTEYIIVDIPLQMGMGSPYSSSCFILIDR